jgi:hypothetical protein
MLDLGVWPNDIEEPWVVGDEIRCPELGVTNVISAICSLKVVAEGIRGVEASEEVWYRTFAVHLDQKRSLHEVPQTQSY